jgi:hypothetical protein
MADLTTIYGNLDPDVIRRQRRWWVAYCQRCLLRLPSTALRVGNVDVMEQMAGCNAIRGLRWPSSKPEQCARTRQQHP